MLSARQVQNRVEDIRGKVKQIHDLTDAGPRDVAERRDFRVVGDRSGAYQSLEA